MTLNVSGGIIVFLHWKTQQIDSLYYEGKSIIIRNAVVLVYLLAALVVLRRWRIRGFIVIISAQVWCCEVSFIVAALPLIMAAPLSACTKEEQRSVIRVLWSEGVSEAAIHQRPSVQYGNSVLLQRSVYDWIEKLKNGRTNVTHDKGAWRPSTAITEDNIERARDVVLLDRRLTIDDVAHVLQISHGSAYELMHNKLRFHKVCARWVPKQLTDVHKQTRVDICKNIWIAMVTNETSSQTKSSLVTKYGSIITSRRVNGRVWNGNIHIHNRPARKSSKPIHPQEN